MENGDDDASQQDQQCDMGVNLAVRIALEERPIDIFVKSVLDDAVTFWVTNNCVSSQSRVGLLSVLYDMDT